MASSHPPTWRVLLVGVCLPSMFPPLSRLVLSHFLFLSLSLLALFPSISLYVPVSFLPPPSLFSSCLARVAYLLPGRASGSWEEGHRYLIVRWFTDVTGDAAGSPRWFAGWLTDHTSLSLSALDDSSSLCQIEWWYAHIQRIARIHMWWLTHLQKICRNVNWMADKCLADEMFNQFLKHADGLHWMSCTLQSGSSLLHDGAWDPFATPRTLKVVPSLSRLCSMTCPVRTFQLPQLGRPEVLVFVDLLFAWS